MQTFNRAQNQHRLAARLQRVAPKFRGRRLIKMNFSVGTDGKVPYFDGRSGSRSR